MGVREKLDEKIRRKRLEIQELQGKIREAGSYIQALEEAAKLLPREAVAPVSADTILRPGSGAHKAFMALQSAGRALHISDIMKAIGMQGNKNARIALSGTLSRYSRNQQVFKRTAPNTFSIIETHGGDEPPDDFGSIAEEPEEAPDGADSRLKDIFG